MTSVVDALGEWEHMRLQCFSSEIVLAVGSENEVLEKSGGGEAPEMDGVWS